MKLTLCILIFVPTVFFAQFGNQDFGTWGGLSVNKEVADDLKIDADFQVRTDDNSTRLNQFFFDLGAKYKVNKYLRTGISWRSKMKNNWSGYELENRLYFDLTGKLKLNDISLYLRSRTQTTSNRNFENPAYQRIRFKFKAKLDKGLKAFLQDEFFFHLNGTGTCNYKKNRFGLGFEYEISDYLQMSLKYLRITEVNQAYPLRMNVIALGLSYSIE
ncbi:DUF2490 domain-containing protein [Flavobacteriales bacterium]|nr:DUF2490 domain-containing protein [Flavobacteriales bacterium]